MQEEECTEKFKKVCFIEYKNLVFNQPITVCKESFTKNCLTKTQRSCKTEYRTKCFQKQEEHEVIDDVVECKTYLETKCLEETYGYISRAKCSKWPKRKCSVHKKKVKKYIQTTSCRKEPIEVCVQPVCTSIPGPEECQTENVTAVQSVPEEVCFLDPYRSCIMVTKTQPKLAQEENCLDVPKETCFVSKAK